MTNKSIEVDVFTYVPSKGGFLKPIRLEIDEVMGDCLSGKRDGGQRGVFYWGAVRKVTLYIAQLLGIPEWKETIMETTMRGDINAPVQIISFSKVKKQDHQ